MTEKRYYQRDFEELYYIIDSNVVSEKEFDERVEYDGYTAFEDSMTGEKIVDLLNENEQLKKFIDYHLNVCKTEKKKITDIYDWGMPQRQGKTVSNELLLKYIGAIEVLEQIKKELKGDME